MRVVSPFRSWRMSLRRVASVGGSTCLVCRSWCDEGVCTGCLERFAPPQPRCDCCALPVPIGLTRCGACLLTPPVQRRSVAALPYAFPWDGLVQRFKYRAAPELAAPLARRLAQAVSAAGTGEAMLLVPVPLSPTKLRERGYNQAWELARRVAASLALPADAGVLSRVVDGPAQQGGSREQRRRQVQAAFAVPPTASSRLLGRHIALIDDVMTTGATAEAASGALLRAGAASVQVWVLARASQAVH